VDYKKEYTLQEMCEFENKGFRFAKIAKSNEFSSQDGIGSRYPYKLGINQIDSEKGLTIVTMEHVMNFLHYGDLLVVISFNELAKKLPENLSFWITRNTPPDDYQFQTNIVYAADIISLKTHRAYEIIINSLNEGSETGISKICRRIYTLNERAADYYDAVQYYEDLLNQKFPNKCPKYLIIGKTEVEKGIIFKRKCKIDTQTEISYSTYQILYEHINALLHPGMNTPEPLEINGIKFVYIKSASAIIQQSCMEKEP